MRSSPSNAYVEPPASPALEELRDEAKMREFRPLLIEAAREITDRLAANEQEIESRERAIP